MMKITVRELINKLEFLIEEGRLVNSSEIVIGMNEFSKTEMSVWQDEFRSIHDVFVQVTTTSQGNEETQLESEDLTAIITVWKKDKNE